VIGSKKQRFRRSLHHPAITQHPQTPGNTPPEMTATE
jgi:hypothetical protein